MLWLIGILQCLQGLYTKQNVPLIIYSALSLFAAFTSIFLPETLNQELPRTIGEAETFGRFASIISYYEELT